MSKESISNVYLILEKIEYIEKIVTNAGSITGALEDNEIGKNRPELVLQNSELNHGDYPTTIILPLTTSLEIKAFLDNSSIDYQGLKTKISTPLITL